MSRTSSETAGRCGGMRTACSADIPPAEGTRRHQCLLPYACVGGTPRIVRVSMGGGLVRRLWLGSATAPSRHDAASGHAPCQLRVQVSALHCLGSQRHAQERIPDRKGLHENRRSQESSTHKQSGCSQAHGSSEAAVSTRRSGFRLHELPPGKEAQLVGVTVRASQVMRRQERT
jgi:hypothetical protein